MDCAARAIRRYLSPAVALGMVAVSLHQFPACSDRWTLLAESVRATQVSIERRPTDTRQAATNTAAIVAAVEMLRIEEGVRRAADPLAQFTPDGRGVSVVLWRGLLDRNRTEWSLRLFPTDGTSLDARGKSLLTLTSSGNGPAISRVKWLDNHTFAFLRSVEDDPGQVYTYNLRTDRLVQRTFHRTPVLFYDISADGRTVAYAARSQRDVAARDVQRFRGVVVAADESPAETDADDLLGFDIELHLQEADAATTRRVTTLTDAARTGLIQWGSLALSPDHQHLALGFWYMPGNVPPSWLPFANAGSDSLVAFSMNAIKQIPPTTALIEVSTGTVTPLLDAPGSVSSSVIPVWAPDGKTLLVHGFLPFDPDNVQATRLAGSVGALIEVNPRTRAARVVKEGLWRIARWTGDGRVLSLVEVRSNSGQTAVVTLTRQNDEWYESSRITATHELFHPRNTTTTDGRFVVGVNQSLDRAPEVAILDTTKKESQVLSDLNPGLRSLKRGPISRVGWTSARGDEWQAHLVTPVDYIASHKYPAVVMNMDMTYSDQYVLDGRVFQAAYPVQALVDNGFIVLMVYNSTSAEKHSYSPEEGPTKLAGNDGAWDYLVSRGFVDSERIGLVGFSHAGWETQYQLANSRHRYAAAIAIDNWEASYVTYVLMGGGSTATPRYLDEAMFGGPPWGTTADSWYRNALGFQPHRIRTPLLIEVHDGEMSDILAFKFARGFELFAGLRRLRKPVDAVRYRYGAHILRRPLEQMSSAERQVDWFRFWLQSEEDPSPQKEEQFQRWRRLRDLLPGEEPR